MNLSAALNAGSSFEISTGLSTASLAPGGTATVSVRPRTGLGEGTHTGTLTIGGSNGVSISVGVSFTVNGYRATISPMDKAFPAATAGYGIQVAQQFTITNTGTGTITSLYAALNGASSFEISNGLSATSLAPGGTATVGIRPRTGLGAVPRGYADHRGEQWGERRRWLILCRERRAAPCNSFSTCIGVRNPLLPTPRLSPSSGHGRLWEPNL